MSSWHTERKLQQEYWKFWACQATSWDSITKTKLKQNETRKHKFNEPTVSKFTFKHRLRTKEAHTLHHQAGIATVMCVPTPFPTQEKKIPHIWKGRTGSLCEFPSYCWVARTGDTCLNRGCLHDKSGVIFRAIIIAAGKSQGSYLQTKWSSINGSRAKEQDLYFESQH